MGAITTRQTELERQVAEMVHEMAGWEGVEIEAADEKTVQVRFGRVELGHLHGSAAAHLPFPRNVRDDLIALGHVTPHPMFPSSGWAERRIRSGEDLATVRLLFRLNYERALNRETIARRRVGVSAMLPERQADAPVAFSRR